jgi:GNAT superfamily N-acetyltransferase
MNDRIEISPPDFRDWDGLLALLRESFAYMDGLISPPSSLQGMTPAQLQAKASREHLLLWRDGGRLLGCAFADLRADCVYVGKLAVAAQARQQGVARALLAAADRLAREQGRAWLELQTRVELVDNHRTFGALGFQTTALTSHLGFTRPTSLTMRRAVSAPPDPGKP